MKQDEKAENQEPSIQVMRNQPNHAAMATNGDFSSTPQFQCPKFYFSELDEFIGELSNEVYSTSDGSYQNRTKSLAPIQEDNHHSSPNLEHLMGTNNELNFPQPILNVDVCSAIEAEKETIKMANLVRFLEENVDETSGEQADKSCDSMDCDNSEQLPFAKDHVKEIENKLNEEIMNGNRSSSSTEMSSKSGTSRTNARSRMEHWMSPPDPDPFPNGDLFDLYDLISGTEADTGVIQYGQYGETSWDNCWPKKNQRPVCDTLEGAVPLEEEKGFVEEKLNHPHDTEKIITECTSSVGAQAKAKEQAAEFKGKKTTMIQPQNKDDVKIESDNVFCWETWNDSLSPTRLTASTSCHCRNKSDPGVFLTKLCALAFVAYVICRISEGINETIRQYLFYRGVYGRF
ncbi:hypothetical protein BT93_G0346 [Corymbia citriodora subsp. variegata]|nr:hypothetical protein BT93_G0346 [Corymbia citriodora subsp. variegata]